MVVEIEKPLPSTRPALDYNEGKVVRGVAELIGYANLEGTSQKEVYDLFERYERTRYYMAQKSFHASVNPSASDTITEDQVLDFITGLMDHLGYGEQPFLVYRHFDIDREHYHIVSVRADRHGRKINNYYEKRRATQYMRSVAARYGFTMADGGAVETESITVEGPGPGKPRRFDARRAVASQLIEIFGACLQYDFTSEQQLFCILEDFGVKAMSVPGDSGPHIALQGVGADGKAVTEWFPEGALGEPLQERMAGVIARNRERHPRRLRERDRARGLVGFAFGVSKSEGHFSNILSNKGIRMHVFRSGVSGEPYGATFIDHVTRTAFKASELGGVFSVRMMGEALSSGKWRAVERGSALTPGGKVRASRASIREEAVRVRDLHVGAVARILQPAVQPRGASWSGKVAPTEEQKEAKYYEEASGALNVSFEDRRLVERVH